jgi:hypothetical protein
MDQYIRYTLRIHAFMEEKELKVYTPDVGKQFCDANDVLLIFNWAKEESRTVVHLLNLIIFRLPILSQNKYWHYSHSPSSFTIFHFL